VKGIDHERGMVLVEMEEAMRTDHDFLEKAANLMTPKNSDLNENDDEVDSHVVGVSPLFHCETQLVSKFRLDGMHLIDKSVSRRIFEFWKHEVGFFKLSNNPVKEISSQQLNIAEWLPTDFNRLPNNFEYVLKYSIKQQN